MTVLPFAVVAFGTGCLALLTRRDPSRPVRIGIAGLLATLATAFLIGDEAPVLIGQIGLGGTAYARVFLMLGTAAGLLVAVVVAVSGGPRTLSGATLLALGAGALALASVDAPTAILAATVGSVAAVVVSLPSVPPDRGLIVTAGLLRACVGAGVLGLVAVAAAAPFFRGVFEPALVPLAYVGVAVAVAIRLGAIPFHVWGARVADAVPAGGLPVIAVLGPAIFAAVALRWTTDVVGASGATLDLERALILVAAAVSIGFGLAAALVHDDLERVVAYGIVGDAGVTLLAFATLDPAAWAAARTWLVAFVMAKTALAASMVAVEQVTGARRVSELRGWARRAPLLGVALVATGIASVGWPGAAVFDARRILVGVALDGPLESALLALALGSVAIHVRLLVAGGRSAGRLPEAERSPGSGIATAAVLGLAALALLVGAGGLGVEAAAAGT